MEKIIYARLATDASEASDLLATKPKKCLHE